MRIPPVKALMREVLAITEDVPVACHFHDTRGLGLANVVAALDAGVRSFDFAQAVLAGVRSRRMPLGTSIPKTLFFSWNPKGSIRA